MLSRRFVAIPVVVLVQAMSSTACDDNAGGTPSGQSTTVVQESVPVVDEPTGGPVEPLASDDRS